MITATKWVFSTAQDVATTAISTNVYTNGPVASGNVIDLGSGVPLYGRVHIGANAAGATSVDFQIVTATDNTLSTSVRVHASTGVRLIAAILAGDVYDLVLPPNGGPGGAYQEFIGYRYVVVGTLTGTGCAIDALITAAHPDANVVTPFQHGMNFYP